MKEGDNEMSDYLQFLTNVGIGGAHPGGLPLTKAILANEPIEKTTDILDVGCGTGQTAAYIAKCYGCHVIALDNEKKMLEKAATRFQNERVDVQLVESTAERLPFKNNRFDYVLAESVITFTEVDTVLNQCFRVLKSGGQLLAIEMTKVANDVLREDDEKQVQSFYGIKAILTEDEWCSKMKAIGFTEVNVMTFGEKYSKKGLEEISELTLSPHFDFHALRTWLEHQELMTKLRRQITYRVYKATKG